MPAKSAKNVLVSAEDVGALAMHRAPPCRFFQRSHSSAFCFAVNHIRDVTMYHLLIQQD
jgi:hypothetical protein